MLQIIKITLVNKKKTLNKILLISFYFNKLKIILQINNFIIFLIIYNYILILKNIIIYYFEYIYYSYYCSFISKAIFTNLDLQLSLF